MKKALVLIALYSCAVASAQPQPSSGPNRASSTCNIVELLNPMGWLVPGLNDASTKVLDARVKMEGVPDDTRMDVLESRKPKGTVTLVSCPANQLGRLEVRSQEIRVLELWRFKRNGRIFAYRVNAGLSAGDIALGAAVELLFYDPDGSGQFTIQRYIDDRKPWLIIPNWVAARHDQ